MQKTKRFPRTKYLYLEDSEFSERFLLQCMLSDKKIDIYQPKVFKEAVDYKKGEAPKWTKKSGSFRKSTNGFGS